MAWTEGEKKALVIILAAFVVARKPWKQFLARER